MSSLSWNTLGASPFPAGWQDFQAKKSHVLRHLAGSERLIDVRPVSRLEVRPRPEMLSTGVAEIDALTGGIPRGCLTEIWGPASSGKTSLLLAAIATATRREETCVLIDASDSFDPSSAAKAGVNFGKLLWVRCGSSAPSLRSGQAKNGRRPSAFKFSTTPNYELSQTQQAENREPRAERKTLADDRYQLALSEHRESKGPRADDVPRTSKQQSERRLEQVLKTTDLVLQSGGFGLVALDLSGIPEKFVRRIPLASWFRFQRTVEHTKTALLVVSECPCAQTCAALAMKLSAVSHQPSEKPTHTQILEGLHVEAEVMRTRLERKPMQSVRATFESKAVRTGGFSASAIKDGCDCFAEG